MSSTDPPVLSDQEREDPLTDVILEVDGKRFYTSKSLLALASPVFRCMFTSQFKEKDQAVIELPGKRQQDVYELLRFINPGVSDALEEGTDSAFRLLPLADEYQIQTLKDKCEETILRDIY